MRSECFLLLGLVVSLSQPLYTRHGYAPKSYGQRGVSHYGSQAQYGQGVQYVQYRRKPVNYQSGSKAVAVQLHPRCIKELTRLEIFLLTPDGKCYPGALLEYVDSGQTKSTKTDGQGRASVLVGGCDVGVSVSVTPDYQPLQQGVNLELNTASTRNVVLRLKHKCNFQMWFQSSQGDNMNSGIEQWHDSISYMFSTSTGSNGYGVGMGGHVQIPLCIYVNVTNADETLTFKVTGAGGGNSVNKLILSKFDQGGLIAYPVYGARITIPIGLVSIDARNLLFTLYLNLWRKGKWEDDDNSLQFDYVYVFTPDGTELDHNVPFYQVHTAVVKSEIEDKAVEDEDLLVGIDLSAKGFINGNCAFVDCQGVTTCVHAPTTVQLVDGVLDSWVPLCMCKGDPKNVKIVRKEASLLAHEDSAGDDVLPINNKCFFYLLCPCPSDFDMAEDCSADDIVEFFCHICKDCPLPSGVSETLCQP